MTMARTIWINFVRDSIVASERVVLRVRTRRFERDTIEYVNKTLQTDCFLVQLCIIHYLL